MASSNIVTLTEKNFDSTVLGHGNTPVLVDFWAPWCAPCRAIAPVLDQLADAYVGRAVIAKVNVDEEPNLAGAAGIQAIPTLLLLRNGKVVDVIQGLRSKADLQGRIDAAINESGHKGQATAAATH